MDAARHVGMEQIRGRDLFAGLVRFGVREVVSVPAFSCVVVLIKEMNFLAGRQINVRVLLQQAMQRGCSTFLGAEAKEVR